MTDFGELVTTSQHQTRGTTTVLAHGRSPIPSTLVDHAFRSADLTRVMPVTPAAIVVHTPTRLEITCGVAPGSGLVLTHERDRWVFASSVPGLLAALQCRPALSPQGLGAWLMLSDGGVPPLQGVHLLGRGQQLVLTPGQHPKVRTWFKPDDPAMTGSAEELVEEYALLLREVVMAHLPARGDVAALMSAGLDSTAVVAVAADLLGPHRTVRAFCSQPWPHEGPIHRRLSYTDLPDAEFMAARWPNVVVEGVTNTPDRTPLDALPAWFEVTGIPATNPLNVVWVEQAYRRAAERGTGVMLTGASGNLTFSWEPMDLPWRLVKSGQVGTLMDHLRARSLASGASMKGETYRLLAPLVARFRHRTPQRMPLLGARLKETLTASPSPYVEPWKVPWHPRHLQQALALPLDEHSPVRSADPLGTEPLIRFAARLPPEAFTGVADGRSFARRVMQGQVPDAIRLRTTIGLQSPDVGQWLQDNDRWRRQALAIIDDPAVAEVVDVRLLGHAIDQAFSRGSAWTIEADRALGAAAYVRWYHDGGLPQ